jgi:hypothetical protein
VLHGFAILPSWCIHLATRLYTDSYSYGLQYSLILRRVRIWVDTSNTIQIMTHLYDIVLVLSLS